MKRAMMGPESGRAAHFRFGKLQLQGHHPSRRQTWTKTPPTFLDVRKEVESRIEDGCKELAEACFKTCGDFSIRMTVRSRPIISSDDSL